MSNPPRQKMAKGRYAGRSNSANDERFSHISTDPRFRLPSRRTTHVALDKRFARMLHDDDFSKKASVDRYGRKIPKSAGKTELQRFYRLEDERDERRHQDVTAEDQDIADDDDDVQRELARVDRKYDPAREGGFSSSSDESSSAEDTEEEAATDQDDRVNALPEMKNEGENDVPMGEISSRLALVNLDWDNIRAVDLMAVFSSFCPPTGRILRVAIYPSQFGKERMEREEMEGPPKEIFATKHNEGTEGLPHHADDGDKDDEQEIRENLLREDKGEEFDSTKLRRYQLERLRYYYAVLTVSSAEAAKALYDATDGAEYLTTANFFDLRFVPDEVSFEGDHVHDECTSIPEGYRPNTFVTDALQHSKVKLTWDAEDITRNEAVKKAFRGSRADIEDNDLKAYLGSDSSDDDGPAEEAVADSQPKDGEVRLSKKERERQRLRAALGLADAPASSKRDNQKAPVGDMQITFSAGLTGPTTKGAATSRKDPERDETTVEKYKRKEKERKQKRKERAMQARHGEEDAIAQLPVTMNDQRPKTKSKSGDHSLNGQTNSDLGFDDPFFTSAVDTTSAAASRKAARKERREALHRQNDDDTAASQKRAELELLMLDDPLNKHDHASSGTKHFDMKEILRAEKAARRKKRSSSSKHKSNAGVEDVERPQQQQQQDGFHLNVKDPRFAALYQSHEFAIDPTNPRFKDTQGMRALLNETRKKRRARTDEEETELVGGDGRGHLAHDYKDEEAGSMMMKKIKKRRKEGVSVHNEDDDLARLVEKVKRRGGGVKSGGGGGGI